MKHSPLLVPSVGGKAEPLACQPKPLQVQPVSLGFFERQLVRTVSIWLHTSVSVGLHWAFTTAFPSVLIKVGRPSHLGKELEVTPLPMRC